MRSCTVRCWVIPTDKIIAKRRKDTGVVNVTRVWKDIDGRERSQSPVVLKPKTARRFAKGIIQMCDEIEGVRGA